MGSTVVGWDQQIHTIQASGEGRRLAVASIVVVVRSPVGTGDMQKLHRPSWAKRHRICTFLTALLYAGLTQTPSAFAQSLESEPTSQSGVKLIPGGSAFGPGGIAYSGPTGFDQNFTPSARYGLTLGPDPTDADTAPQYWFEFGGAPRTDHGMNAQIGFGYSPSPDVGLSVGPFLDLDAATPGNLGVYQTNTFGVQQHVRPSFGITGTGVSNDAGLAGSLSYMPLEDIWIGLHGSVSRDLTPANPTDGLLDGIDAMLGLTASYRVQF